MNESIDRYLCRVEPGPESRALCPGKTTDPLNSDHLSVEGAGVARRYRIPSRVDHRLNVSTLLQMPNTKVQ